jgi:poly-gamma-glutamate synthesis protein (capsule biosynthesis protein)
VRSAWGIAAVGVAATLVLPALPARSTPPPVSITIVGVGDVLSHREIIDQARVDAGARGGVDFRPMLEGVRPLVERADLAICHMEFALGSRRGPWTAWPDVPNSPPQLADAMSAVGFDACSTASNHSLDQGFAGVVRTIEAIEGAGMVAFGTARSKREARTPRVIEVKGVPIGLLSYSYGWNGMPVPSGQPWCCPLIDATRVVADARLARERGARLVVVSLHHGVEGVRDPTVQQTSVVRQLARSGAVDLVLGHHAHVVQPVDLVDGMWVAYGHGNLLSAQSRRDPRSGDGLLTSFTFTEQADGSFEVSRAAGYAVRNADFPFRLHVVGPRESASQADRATWRRTREAVLLLGAQAKGFRLVRLPSRS